ncbi:HAD-IA family hydrolase [Nocardioides koreensis]|uniref:HAD-IA family hydrolase n=1 Tax=Nocardioides koreensis TaxID=433651 RepID=A0ABN2ZX33_9ACTN
MRPAALLLDLDGTLVDSEPLHREAYRVFLADRGWVIDDLGIFTGRRAEDVFAVEPGPWSQHDPHELAAEVRARVPDDATPEPVPGAHDVVHTAGAAGIPVAIVTSARPAWVSLAVGEGLGVLDHIDVVVTARDVTEGKPHPAGFLLACERLGVSAADCVAAEDSPAGVAAAVAAGVGRVVGVTTTWTEPELTRAGAHVVLPDLRGVVDLLR